MADSLPMYAQFDLYGENSSLSQRWTKWIRGFQTLMVGMNITDKTRKRALLLYYAGEAIHDLFVTLSNTGNDNDFDAAATALKTHMDHYKNTEGLVQEFRKEIQSPSETIDAFHTRLQQKAALCEFHDVTREIRSQLITGCASHKIRLFALDDSKITLTKILDKARNREVADMLACQMEEKLPKTVNYVNQPYKHDKPKTYKTTKGTKSCWFCGGSYPHSGNCPADGKLCNNCGKSGHFSGVCRGQKSANSHGQPKYHNKHDKHGKWKSKKQFKQVKHITEDNSSSGSEIFAIKRDSSTPPMSSVQFGDETTRIDMVVDSGSPRDMIGENTYRNFANPPKLHSTSIKLYPYCSSDPLDIVGKFKSRITCDQRTAVSTVYVVKGSATNLLSVDTSKALALLQLKESHKSTTSGLRGLCHLL